jgi:hypothetical protein
MRESDKLNGENKREKKRDRERKRRLVKG